MPSSPYRTVGEAALHLGVHEKWVYRHLARGIIPGAFKIDGRWFIHWETFLEWLERLRQTPVKRRVIDPNDNHGLLK